MGGKYLSRYRSLLLAVALSTAALSASVAVPGDAAAQPPSKADEAKARYLKGVNLFDEGDYQSALIEFKRSYELVPNFNVLYNIGQVHFQLADYASALKTLQLYLEEGGKRIPASRRSDVERDVDKLKARVAQVTLKINVPGAEVRIDDQSNGQAVSGPIVVSAGKRKFEVSKPGYKTVSKTEEIAGQENKEIVFELQPDTGGGGGGPDGDGRPPVFVVGDQGRTAPAPDAGPPVAPIVLWSLTGALAISTGVLGGLALAADSTLQELKTTPGRSEDDINAQADNATTLALVSDILLGGTLAAAGAATIFTVLAFTNGDETPAAKQAGEKPREPAARSSLRLGPGFASFEGTF